ncbi:MAG: iron ABC transporter permease [Pseudomonadota bacterium]|jgi:iron complex transport system permease protein|nr:iron ABC transporter permease [Pseudomonadota bacterium]
MNGAGAAGASPAGKADGAAARPVSRERRGRRLVRMAAGLAFLALFAGIMIGPVRLGVGEVLLGLAGALGLADASELGYKAQVLQTVRLPRVLLAAAAGAALSVSGAVMQGMFRNPLADPGLIGVSAGGALAAVAVIVLGPGLLAVFGGFALPLAAFLGSLATTGLIYRVSQFDGRVVIPVMLLSGVAANALAGALIGYLTFLSDEQQLRLLTFWTLGSVGAASWQASLPAIAVMVVATALALRLARPLNALLLGEDAAMHLGVEVATLKRRSVLLTALGVGAAVSACGIVGFLGLVTPHLVRLLTGPDHRFVLPASAFVGAALMLSADLVARTVVGPAELPLGVVTAMVGAPFLFWLLQRRRGAEGFG